MKEKVFTFFLNKDVSLCAERLFVSHIIDGRNQKQKGAPPWLEIFTKFVKIFIVNNIIHKKRRRRVVMSYELLWEAKKVLEPLLKEAQMKSSTGWGPKVRDNIHSGPNIVFRVGDDVVIISQPGKRLKMQEFTKAADTELGKRVRNLFQRAAAVPERREILSLSAYTAYCDESDGWREEFDAGLLREVDSRGAGSRELIREIYEEHERVHPGCDPAHVVILDPQMVRVGLLSELLAIKRTA